LPRALLAFGKVFAGSLPCGVGKEFFAESFFAESFLPRATWQALGKDFAEGF